MNFLTFRRSLWLLCLLLTALHTQAQQTIADFISVEPMSQNTDFVIPSTHRFQRIIEQGDALTAGGTLGDNLDFTGYVPINGSSENGYLSINSETTPGGVTVLDINFNSTSKLWETTASEAVDFSGVGGTARNCSGTVTPWNTVVSCEETTTTTDANSDGYNDLGWNVEIDPVTRTVIGKRWAMGNFAHENIVVHSNRRTVYQGADSNPGYLYKFVADSAEDLSSGDLYVYSGSKNGSGDWVQLNNTTQLERNTTLIQSAFNGGTVFNGIEDVEIGPNGMIYFAVKGEDQVYRFQDSDPLTGTTVPMMETYVGDMAYTITHNNGTTLENWGSGNDNMAFDGAGNLWVHQDGGNDYIWVVENGHTQANPKVKIFGRTPSGSEPTGITFSPDFRFMFMSIQHPSSSNSASTQTDAAGEQVAFDRDVTIVIALNDELGTACPAQGTACNDGDANTIFDEEDGNCNCIGIPADANELTYNVAQSSDDAEEDMATGSVSLTSSDLEFVVDGTEVQMIGIRFDNVQLPVGSTLYRAYLQFQVDETSSDTTNLVIKGEANSNSATFTPTSSDISSRSTTSNEVYWNDIESWNNAGDAGLAQRSPYVNAIISEVTGQTGWTSGNAITFLIDGEGYRVAESFDGSGGPELKIFYANPCPAEGTPCNDGDVNTFYDVEDGNCNCVGIAQAGIMTYQVEASSDDAEQAETGGNMYLGSSDLELVFDSFDDQNNQTVGIRFNNIHLPANAIIADAYIQFTTDETDNGATSLNVQGEYIGDASTFTSNSFDISSRNTTTVSVSWANVAAWNTVGEQDVNQRTPNLTPIVEEILQHPDWGLLNSMAFIITGTGTRTAESYDGDASLAPQLVIAYQLDALSTESTFESDVRVYPNPTQGNVSVDMGDTYANVSVKVSNALGQSLMEQSFQASQQFSFEIEGEAGIYIVELRSGEQRAVLKVVKK